VTTSSARYTDDHLWYAFLLAVALHALVLLGVGFERDPGVARPEERLLEIMVVRPKPAAEKPPEQPEALAQTAQQGGAADEVVEISARPSGPLAQPAPPEPPPVEAEPVPIEEPAPTPPAEEMRAAPAPAEKPAVVAPPVERPKRTSAASLLASTQIEIDRLTTEIDRRNRGTGSSRRKAVNASTQEYKYAAYLEAWRQKVERVGNLNYPDEAKQQKLYGDLILHVALRPDGSVDNIRVVRSSGQKVLDDAAIRIVRLAAPFAPFPPDIRAEADVLDITRTWQFMSGNRLFSSR
jgi:protein TonB